MTEKVSGTFEEERNRMSQPITILFSLSLSNLEGKWQPFPLSSPPTTGVHSFSGNIRRRPWAHSTPFLNLISQSIYDSLNSSSPKILPIQPHLLFFLFVYHFWIIYLFFLVFTHSSLSTLGKAAAHSSLQI